MSIKINKFEIENVKRVKAVKVEPTANGLTVIGGKNRQGKTSVLDAIAWALGGNRFKPSEAQREGSVIPPTLHIVLSNGLVVERKGKNSDLKITDPSGNKAGQNLLDGFVEELALDLPKFMEQSDSEKAQTLLKIIGVGDKLFELEQEEKTLYNQRLAIGQIADQKEKYAKEQPYYTDAPKELVSPAELVKQQSDILARNGENNRKRQNLTFLEAQEGQQKEVVIRLEQQLAEAREKLSTLTEDVITAKKTALDLHDESTEELEKSITNIEETNRLVRANLDKDKAEDDAKGYRDQYSEYTKQIDAVRKSKTDLLERAELPLPGLSVQDGKLVYGEKHWDCMSGADQLKVATSIVRKLNPECGFVLLDKLEQMDTDELQSFGAWLEAEGLQAIATRVSTGSECSLIIEDGYVKDEEEPAPAPDWKAGMY